MPSHSKSQYKFMEMCSYNKKLAEARNIDQEVAREWHAEDEKKKKEDPEWFENLPEKAEKKKAKGDHEYSQESFLGWLFGEKKSKIEDITDKDIAHLRSSPSELRNYTVRVGMVETGNLKHSYFKEWGPNWVEHFLSTCNDLTKLFSVNGRATDQYASEMEKIYAACKSKKDIKEAIEYADKHVPAVKKKFGAVAVPKFDHLTLKFVRKNDGWDFDVNNGAEGGSVKAPTEAQISSMLAAMAKVFSAVDTFGDYDIWTLDDTDDWRYWDNRDATDSDIGELLHHFPVAGELFEMGYVQEMDHFVMNIFSGASTIIGKSLVRKSTESNESRRTTFMW